MDPTPDLTPQQGPSWKRWDAWVFYVILAVQVALILGTTPFPTQDIGAHLETAHIARRLVGGDAAITEVFTWNHKPVPSWVGMLVTMVIGGLLPPEAATKALVLLGMVPLALVMRAVVRRASPDGGWASLLILPMLPNWHVHMGFFSFTFALPVAVAVGAWWVLGGGPRSRTQLALASAALIGLYLLHPVPAGFLLAAVGVLELARTRCEPRRPLAEVIRRLAVLGIPMAVCVLGFALSGAGGEIRYDVPLKHRIGLLVLQHSLDPFGVVNGCGRIVAGLLIAGGAAAALARRASRTGYRPSDGFLILAAAMAAFHLVSPQGVGVVGGFFNQRSSVLPPLFLIPWIASQGIGPRVRTALAVAAAVVVGVLGFQQVTSYARVKPIMREFDSMGEAVPAGASFAVMQRTGDSILPGIAVAVTANRSGYVTIRRNAIERTSYQASAHIFPIVFRDPARDARPLNSYLLGSGTNDDVELPEYLLVWVPTGATPAPRFAQQWINKRYDLVSTTEPSGAGRVYRRRE